MTSSTKKPASEWSSEEVFKQEKTPVLSWFKSRIQGFGTLEQYPNQKWCSWTKTKKYVCHIPNAIQIFGFLGFSYDIKKVCLRQKIAK